MTKFKIWLRQLEEIFRTSNGYWFDFGNLSKFRKQLSIQGIYFIRIGNISSIAEFDLNQPYVGLAKNIYSRLQGHIKGLIDGGSGGAGHHNITLGGIFNTNMKKPLKTIHTVMDNPGVTLVRRRFFDRAISRVLIQFAILEQVDNAMQIHDREHYWKKKLNACSRSNSELIITNKSAIDRSLLKLEIGFGINGSIYVRESNFSLPCLKA